jgi:hypothetical protein
MIPFPGNDTIQLYWVEGKDFIHFFSKVRRLLEENKADRDRQGVG